MDDNNIPRNGKSFNDVKKQENADLQKGKNRRENTRGLSQEKYVQRVEQFAEKRMGIKAPKIPTEDELKSKLGKETVTDKDKASADWKVYGNVERDKKTNAPVMTPKQKDQWEKTGKAKGVKTERKPNIEIKDDGQAVVSHLGSKKSLRHEVAHIVRAPKKNLVGLAQAMDAGFGAIKAKGVKEAKEAKEKGASPAEVKQAARRSNQFAYPGEYETAGVENKLARLMGVAPEDKIITKQVRHPYVGKTDPKTGKQVPEDKKIQVPKTAQDPVQTAMDTKNMGKPIHRVVPGKDGQGRHISHLSSNISPETAEHFDKWVRGEVVYDPQKGWSKGTSIHARINARAREKSKDPTRKDAKTLMRSLEFLANNLEDLGKSELANDVRKIIKKHSQDLE